MVGDDIGIVIIGRNEGERLRRCLQSVTTLGVRVYVDSGSTDGSQDLARSMGFTVLDLGSNEEFTAARARNRGILHIAEHHPNTTFVHTIDGDCEAVKGWLQQACARMQEEDTLAVVFGRRRERFPDRNVYHRACEIEWNVPRGPATSCGGDAMFRMAALTEVGGYNPRLIAGEEPDLCYRLRQANWHIFSDGEDMTLHDVDMATFRQWWRRALRAGHALTELVSLHGPEADKGWTRFVVSAFFWSGLLLLASAMLLASIVLMSWPLLCVAAIIAVVICLQIARTATRARHLVPSSAAGLQWSALIFVSKLAQAQGALLYWRRRLTSSRRAIIEYK